MCVAECVEVRYIVNYAPYRILRYNDSKQIFIQASYHC